MEKEHRPEDKDDQEKHTASEPIEEKRKDKARMKKPTAKRIRRNDKPPRKRQTKKWEIKKAPIKTTEPNNRQEEQEKDRKEQYTQEMKAEKANKETTTRKPTLWEDIGLAEYNPETRIWECRIDDCEAKMETTKKISHRRENTTRGNTLDPTNKT